MRLLLPLLLLLPALAFAQGRWYDRWTYHDHELWMPEWRPGQTFGNGFQMVDLTPEKHGKWIIIPECQLFGRPERRTCRLEDRGFQLGWFMEILPQYEPYEDAIWFAPAIKVNFDSLVIPKLVVYGGYTYIALCSVVFLPNPEKPEYWFMAAAYKDGCQDKTVPEPVKTDREWCYIYNTCPWSASFLYSVYHGNNRITEYDRTVWSEMGIDPINNRHPNPCRTWITRNGKPQPCSREPLEHIDSEPVEIVIECEYDYAFQRRTGKRYVCFDPAGNRLRWTSLERRMPTQRELMDGVLYLSATDIHRHKGVVDFTNYTHWMNLP